MQRFSNSVAPSDGSAIEQRVRYHEGVGVHWWDRWSGGAFGLGLSDVILDVYRWVVANFDPGDELFFLGFSPCRGCEPHGGPRP